ncbi:PREDICTED: dol-P-Glc:Glc(2)Man(9)GlcNAc(2)-PP-Dol alpha-1,2-glucosyltransferase-like [Amphimedon queenslandica]|uniref:Dol-P-Glc:Glc(2)Man(9)GlcNAc(2)-PP-Dol alpha-1,2-glucosyltransferase n=1 Tax=Amphimedon queenslandica TaxID=400682 RepID=A0A1X7VBF2_AMPQE|nr:PREDICTED: dol-P-Glc:Glc(2)Man(9)GlcNAc(2)-PP-Dol alpha-1,2-glucosyltransferase-like [Amphimedon queenslandica]|eukprot:XP_003384944.1 PREDICTED: dol-P-Glc:Glc(2)Man(9)GlcNAc(2)-PP-Dol alpha-1,2-glucosyltransferase-like [Amphimedon queenslandica]
MAAIMLLLGVSILALLNSIILYYINETVPSPYMDEIFHVPQAQQYCRNNFSHWDPMITTPPGLYLISLLTIKPLSSLFAKDLCITSLLRAQNVLFSLISFIVFHSLLSSIHSQLKPTLLMVMSSLTLSLFPPLFFFNFLYYTDVGSTLFVLFGYLMSRQHRHLLASISLGVSLLFRQTNIVWAAFVGGASILRHLELELSRNKKLPSLFYQFITLLKTLLFQLPAVLSWVWSYVLLGIGFMIFIIINNGVVLGDRSHHIVSTHVPQVMYFSCFVCFFSFWNILFRWKLFLKSFFNHFFRYLFLYVLLTAIGLMAAHYYTYEHPYLLADNRHYTFYIWKNIYRRDEEIKYFLTPMYSVCMIIIMTLLREQQSFWWMLLYSGVCIVTLVPQSLFEFRYFIIPYLMFKVHVRPSSLAAILLEVCLYGAINTLTLLIFINKPFQWEGSSQLQRFMW